MVALSRYLGWGLLLCLMAVPAWADEPGDDALDGVAMEVVAGSDDDESDYVETIRLPDELPVDSEAGENAAFDIDTANEAREQASEAQQDFGDSTQIEARDLPGGATGTREPVP